MGRGLRGDAVEKVPYICIREWGTEEGGEYRGKKRFPTATASATKFIIICAVPLHMLISSADLQGSSVYVGNEATYIIILFSLYNYNNRQVASFSPAWKQ